ncbi:MAG TPA: hypothetical protein VG387_06840 [Rhizomicrobium sp.]|jgi:hypothetical protein|nr:hypothetical protein [Rhizomicrobium sp.]
MTLHRIARMLGLCAVAIALFFGLMPAAFADDAAGTGTAVLTLEAPLLDGAPTDVYKTYFLRVRRRDNGKEYQFRYWAHAWAESSPNDLAATGGTGTVFTQALDAGDWEVFLFQIDTTGSAIRWRPAQEFSIPFTIHAGRAAYIGDFRPLGQNFKGSLGDYPGGVRFVVADRSARDIPLATAKTPGLGPVDVGVFNVDTMHNPLFSSTDAFAAPYDQSQFCRYMNLIACAPNL